MPDVYSYSGRPVPDVYSYSGRPGVFLVYHAIINCGWEVTADELSPQLRLLALAEYVEKKASEPLTAEAPCEKIST